MQYTNYQPTPVYSSDGQPLMPTHPARARRLMQHGRAVPHHVRGLFGIRLLHRTRAESSVQDAAINIDPGSRTTGIAVVADNNEDSQRTVLAALELKHRASSIKATLTKRRAHRRTRRGRLRFRKPRFDNRHRKTGTLPPCQGAGWRSPSRTRTASAQVRVRWAEFRLRAAARVQCSSRCHGRCGWYTTSCRWK